MWLVDFLVLSIDSQILTLNHTELLGSYSIVSPVLAQALHFFLYTGLFTVDQLVRPYVALSEMKKKYNKENSGLVNVIQVVHKSILVDFDYFLLKTQLRHQHESFKQNGK